MFLISIICIYINPRLEVKQYNNGIADALNFICSRYGPIEKRTGTEFTWNLNNPNTKVFLMPFIFSVRQTLLLEFLDRQIRFYTFETQPDGTITFGPVNYEGEHFTITTTITEDKLDKISYVQSLDVIYIAIADGNTVLSGGDKLVFIADVKDTKHVLEKFGD